MIFTEGLTVKLKLSEINKRKHSTVQSSPECITKKTAVMSHWQIVHMAGQQLVQDLKDQNPKDQNLKDQVAGTREYCTVPELLHE